MKVLKEKTSDERIAKHNLEMARLEARKEELAVSIVLLRKGA